MFQEFDNQACPDQGRVRVPMLREELQEQGLTGFIVPRADEFQGEDLAAYAERLNWLTGFTGSAGTAVILPTKAAIFIDGRYTLQVRDQVDTDLLEPVSIPKHSVAGWLEKNMSEKDIVGFDPWIHSVNAVEKLTKTAKQAGAILKAVDGNPVDAIWTDQPERPKGEITPHPMSLAGQSSSEKIATIAKGLEGKADATFITQGDSIAWLFNIRGCDVPRAPLPLAFAIVTAEAQAILIVDQDKLTAAARESLPDCVEVSDFAGISLLLTETFKNGKTCMLDKALVPYAVEQLITSAGGVAIPGSDPCLRPKAAKNDAELEGMRVAHQRDGVAMCQFLYWLDTAVTSGKVDEIEAVKALEAFRAETGCLKDISFETISGAGPNGAIVHYRVTESTNRPLEQDNLFLIDSGGQYPDGTTDITRTIAIGSPSAEMKDRFTRVLKGMIGVSLARFPEGTSGAQLDTLARTPLWQAGLDYAHGTGHGVGSYLCVHEGPHRIAKTGTSSLETGNVLSNEPGYYKTGAFGIRIENLIVVNAPEDVEGGELPLHSFETLTLCPIDQRLIEVSLLTVDEINWLNDYHERVFAELSSDLDEDTRAWLAEATKPLHG